MCNYDFTHFFPFLHRIQNRIFKIFEREREMSSKEGDADETTSSKIENNASEVDATISTMTEGTFFF